MTAHLGPLEALASIWADAKRAFNTFNEVSETVDEALFAVLTTIEAQAALIPPATPREYAFKVIMADDEGDMTGNIYMAALATEARAMVGWPALSVKPAG